MNKIKNQIKNQIKEFHAHVYFDEKSVEQARKLCELAKEQFSLKMGRVHEKPVGPHPTWSCQLAFALEEFGLLVPWLAMNRNGLTVFVHPETGDDWTDHTDYAIWMGEILELKTSIFNN